MITLIYGDSFYGMDYELIIKNIIHFVNPSVRLPIKNH